MRLELQQRLVIQASVLLVNTMFCNKKIRWKIGKDKVINGCRLGEISLDDNE